MLSLLWGHYVPRVPFTEDNGQTFVVFIYLLLNGCSGHIKMLEWILFIIHNISVAFLQ